MLSTLLPSLKLFNLLTFACVFALSLSLLLHWFFPLTSRHSPSSVWHRQTNHSNFLLYMQSFNGAKCKKNERVVQIHWRPVDSLTNCKHHPLGSQLRDKQVRSRRTFQCQRTYESALVNDRVSFWRFFVLKFFLHIYFYYLSSLFILLHGYLNSANIFIYSFYNTSSLLQAWWHIFYVIFYCCADICFL